MFCSLVSAAQFTFLHTNLLVIYSVRFYTNIICGAEANHLWVRPPNSFPEAFPVSPSSQ